MKRKNLAIFWCKFLFLIFTISLSFSGNLKANDFGQEFAIYLEEKVPLVLKRYDIPGATIALIENGEIKAIHAYGYANIEQEIPMVTDHIFRAESITKMFTAWGIMNLVESGKIDLDNPAEDYLTGWSFSDTEFNDREITIRKLLSHSSGLPFGIYNTYTPGDEGMPSLKESLSGEAGAPAAKPVQEPGTSFIYSNPGFGVLELVIEEVSGDNYADFMEREILDPLGMNNSAFYRTQDLSSGMVTNYDQNKEHVQPYIEPVKGHGELHTTAEDLAIFVAAWMENLQSEKPGRGIILPGSIHQLHSPEIKTAGMYKYFSDSYGLGHFVEKLPGGQQVVFHAGEGAAGVNIVCGIPEMGVGIIILTNSKTSWQFLASVLENWIDYLGVEWKGISHIFSMAKIVGWVALTLFFGASLCLFWSLTRGFLRGHRIFKPLSGPAQISRFIRAGLAIFIMGVWWGTSVKEILFWLLPNLSFWLQISLLIFSLLLLFSAMFAKESKNVNVKV
ncbi:MAG: class A beta-lactamase-related serine hydrolase [Bacteroidetes bacterium]|nr:MAG: class A beta-lactamase-related serine hydrolase [Bacteroidota bacterium]